MIAQLVCHLFPPEAIAVAEGDLLTALVYDFHAQANVRRSQELCRRDGPGDQLPTMTISGRAATRGTADFTVYHHATLVQTVDGRLCAWVWPNVQIRGVTFHHDEVHLELLASPGRLPAWMGVDMDEHTTGWCVIS